MNAKAPRPSDKLYGKTRANDVWYRMREDILAGMLVPGQRLRFEKLRSVYDLSYATLREALSKLTHEGLVIADAQRGFMVAPISVKNLLDLTHVREMIETEALKRSIAKGDEEWRSAILSSFHKMDKLGRNEGKTTHEWMSCHREYHASLVSTCDSPLLLEYRATLFDRANRYRRLSKVIGREDPDRSNEHRDIMEAVLTGDVDAVCHLISRHMWETTNRIIEAIPDLESETAGFPRSGRGESAVASPQPAAIVVPSVHRNNSLPARSHRKKTPMRRRGRVSA